MDVKFKGKDIFKEEEIFGHSLPRSGISYRQELDWIFAAWRDNKGYDEFSKTPGWYQSMIVAAYRVEKQIDAVLAEDSAMKAEQERAMQEAERNSRPH